MRILKAKIAYKQQINQANLLQGSPKEEEKVLETTQPQSIPSPPQRQLRNRIIRSSPSEALTQKGATSCKNIMKNYSRIFTTFALMSLARPYLLPRLQEHQINMEDFKEFVESRKRPANCIKGLRQQFLLVLEDDSDEVAMMKTVFKEICVVFLKFYCVNWIFHGKVMDKTAHLSYRLKILRRIQNPACFTYLEDFSR